jgi:hypothetical protein
MDMTHWLAALLSTEQKLDFISLEFINTECRIEWDVNRGTSLNTSKAGMNIAWGASMQIVFMVYIYNSSRASMTGSGQFTKNKSTGAGSCMAISGDTTDSGDAFYYKDLC